MLKKGMKISIIAVGILIIILLTSLFFTGIKYDISKSELQTYPQLTYSNDIDTIKSIEPFTNRYIINVRDLDAIETALMVMNEMDVVDIQYKLITKPPKGIIISDNEYNNTDQEGYLKPESGVLDKEEIVIEINKDFNSDELEKIAQSNPDSYTKVVQLLIKLNFSGF